jgi:protein arginine kinase activator
MAKEKTKQKADELPDDELFCDVCGMTYKEFLETGTFRCENCYKVFKARTVKKIKDAMKKEKPVVKVTKKVVVPTKNAKNDLKEKIEELKKLLELCIKLGEKEKAEQVKEEIARLEELLMEREK